MKMVWPPFTEPFLDLSANDFHAVESFFFGACNP